jgi:hypothetical protein
MQIIIDAVMTDELKNLLLVEAEIMDARLKS